MRRICAVFAGALLLLLTLAACGDDEGVSSLGSSSAGTLADSALNSLAEAESQLEVMTVEETIESFRLISPQVLGLEGESLSEYELFHEQASVPVDGVPCLEITVYGKTATDTNTPLGTYLYARDGTALYHLDVDTDTITRLEMN